MSDFHDSLDAAVERAHAGDQNPLPSVESDAPEAEPFCVPSGWADATFIPHTGGPFYRLLTYPDGTVRFEHRCDLRGRGVIICAPALQIGNGHTVTWAPNNYPGYEGLFDVPTVTPSILCPDCGTHGFITNGRWVDA